MSARKRSRTGSETGYSNLTGPKKMLNARPHTIFINALGVKTSQRVKTQIHQIINDSLDIMKMVGNLNRTKPNI